MNIYSDISKTVGKTPLVKLNHITKGLYGEVLVKVESRNPSFSVKDRIAVNMIDEAEKAGLIKPGDTIIEPTSGNTGLGLAMVSAARGYRLIIAMPESMSIERRKLMKQLGAELVLTEAAKGMGGAISEAEKIHKNNPGSFMPQQFANAANPAAHIKSTAVEIWEDTEGTVDVFIAGVGTGGTLTGVGTYLKEHKPGVEIVAVEPVTSAVLSGEDSGKHSIQGIGAGFVPEILNTGIIDKVVKVSDADSLENARELAKKEGILAGISSGAAITAALELAGDPAYESKRIVVILPDTGERYLSTALFD